ncbi:DeoR/GlpR family DNA-binding transcription regulator [Actinorugispora endophytica]|uniref:Lactose phosphotransferase system repressor n=1 Tax=Actinorugispora endophytica TaxID=1605990 RepID=A0A4R6UKM0_9ACTN|nr:DeoR/GlpR family DNA-binding transcription regulator [Actinorugispora endophytica]TDQ45873.1 DeoR family transcriptional regulator [Actinorugispora endophytica]
MDSAERMDVIVARLRSEGEVGVVELAELTGHSEMTIRRDLGHLSGQGVLRRVRGGAVSLLPRGQEPPYAIRERQAVDAKKRIGEAVGGLVGDGQAVLLDSGTTVLEAARELAGRHVTVMPLSLRGAAALSEGRTAKLLMAGGEVRPGELSLIGPLAEASLGAVRFDTAVLGCCGLSAADGVTAYDLGDVAIKRAAMRSAQRVVLAVDSTKLGQVAMGHVGPVSEIDILVTDTDAPDDDVAGIRAAGVTVHRV